MSHFNSGTLFFLVVCPDCHLETFWETLYERHIITLNFTFVNSWIKWDIKEFVWVLFLQIICLENNIPYSFLEFSILQN